MSVCSASAVVRVAEWFAYGSQNTIYTKRCSGDIDTEALFLWANNHMELLFGVLIVLLVCTAIVAAFDHIHAEQPTD